MTTAEIVEVASNAATVLGTAGGFLAAVWAVHTYFRDRRELVIGEFRKNLSDAIRQFSELAASFQSQIVGILEGVFATDNEEAKRLFTLLQEALSKPSAEEAAAFMRSQSVMVHESILYSMTREMHDMSDSVRFAYDAQIATLATFSPVLHLFMVDAGALVLEPYRRELKVTRIDDYAVDAAAVLWRARADGVIEIGSSDDLKVHYRGVIAQMMAAYRGDVSIVDIIGRTLGVVRMVAAVYSAVDGSRLWRHHREDVGVDLAELDASTRTETLRRIVRWKLRGGANAGKLAQCLAAIDELESAVAGEDGAEDEKAPVAGADGSESVPPPPRRVPTRQE